MLEIRRKFTFSPEKYVSHLKESLDFAHQHQFEILGFSFINAFLSPVSSASLYCAFFVIVGAFCFISAMSWIVFLRIYNIAKNKSRARFKATNGNLGSFVYLNRCVTQFVRFKWKEKQATKSEKNDAVEK